MTNTTIKLAKAVASSSFVQFVPGTNGTQTTNRFGVYADGHYGDPASFGFPLDFHSEVRQCRFFYRYDPIASTTINRMADMCVTKLRNKRGKCTDEEFNYFQGLQDSLTQVLKDAALEYLITGLVIIDYGVEKSMGNKIHSNLGRTRYSIPTPLWVRNPDTIRMKKLPAGAGRRVYVTITSDEANFIIHEGLRPDGTKDTDLYNEFKRSFPEYVALVKRGDKEIPLEHVHPVLRKSTTNSDYPQPFLTPALAPLKHKWRIKQMDYSIATRAIESILHVKVGNDDFPVEPDDGAIDNLRQQMEERRSGLQEIIYRLITNHTVDMKWIYPPLDALLSDQKYNEPNADIFVAMGFSRTLLVGEALRSNSGGASGTAGPIATLNEAREQLLNWVRKLYKDLAELNGFKNIAIPSFPPIPSSEIMGLVQYAIEAAKFGALSKNSVAEIFGTDYETEREQQEIELNFTIDDQKKMQEAFPNQSISTNDGKLLMKPSNEGAISTDNKSDAVPTSTSNTKKGA